MAADYSQVELRIMAHLSRDAGLLSAFQVLRMFIKQLLQTFLTRQSTV